MNSMTHAPTTRTSQSGAPEGKFEDVPLPTRGHYAAHLLDLMAIPKGKSCLFPPVFRLHRALRAKITAEQHKARRKMFQTQLQEDGKLRVWRMP